jgi:hypothetical protein
MGAALINTIATTATASYLAAHGTSPTAAAEGAVHGYTTAFVFSAAVLGAAAVAAFTLIRRFRPDAAPVDADATAETGEPLVLAAV